MIRLCAFSDEAASDLKGQIVSLIHNNIYLTELRSVNGKNVSQFSAAEAKEYQKQLKNNGIAVWSVGSPLGKTEISVSIQEYLDEVRRVCEIANIFQTDKIRMFSFFNAYNERERVIDYLNQMTECASEFGITLYHENEKEIFGDTAERVVELFSSVPRMKFVYDPANYIQVGEPAEKTLALTYAFASYFHIKDVIANTGELVPAGYGDGAIYEILSRISDDKVLTLEPHLHVFDGYAQIDNTQMKHKFCFNSNCEAFDYAAESLKILLKQAGYREMEGGFEKI